MKTVIDFQTYKILDFISDIELETTILKWQKIYSIVTLENNFIICSTEKRSTYLKRKFFTGLKNILNSIADFISDSSTLFIFILVLAACIGIAFIINIYFPMTDKQANTFTIACTCLTLLNLTIILLCASTAKN